MISVPNGNWTPVLVSVTIHLFCASYFVSRNVMVIVYSQLKCSDCRLTFWIFVYGFFHAPAGWFQVRQGGIWILVRMRMGWRPLSSTSKSVQHLHFITSFSTLFCLKRLTLSYINQQWRHHPKGSRIIIAYSSS